MKTSEDLKQILERIDHRGYPAYKDTRGAYQFGTYILGIDHVQGDPFAAPSRLHIQVAGRAARIPGNLYDSKCKRWLWQIICCGILQSNWNGTRFRHTVPEKAGSFR